MAQDLTIPVNSLKIADQPSTINILSGDKVIFTITDGDAKAAGKTRQEITNEYLEEIRNNISKYRQERS